MPDEVLAFQLKETEWGTGFATAVPIKVTPVTELPFIVTEAVDGLNVNPDLLTATTYKPFGRPENVYAPDVFVEVEPEMGPDKVNCVTPDPLAVPEMLYVPDVGGTLAGLKTTSTQ
jgi:hypothetical protein